jgi:hypothetical protein
VGVIGALSCPMAGFDVKSPELQRCAIRELVSVTVISVD